MNETLPAEKVCAHFQKCGDGVFLPVIAPHEQHKACPWCAVAELERKCARHLYERRIAEAAHAQLKQALEEATRPATEPKTCREAIATAVVNNVCELPDYNSPDDQPDLVMCTVQQLRNCVLNALEETQCGG